MEPIEHGEYTYIRICFRNKKKKCLFESLLFHCHICCCLEEFDMN